MNQVKILLIDDDEDDYVLTKNIVEKLPSRYTLSWVSNYSGGINAILNKEYDVYLLDYRLGNITGLELLSEAINSGCEQPIIMLTGKGDVSVDEKAMNLGAADYLIKDDLESSLLERSIRYAIKQTAILKSLQTSENKYRTIFEQAVDPIIVADSDGNIIDMNVGGLKFFGYKREGIVGKNEQILFKDRSKAKSFKQLLEAQGIVNEFQCAMVTKNGLSFDCALSSFIYTDMASMSEVYHTTIRDVSYRKNVEEESVQLGKLNISEHIAKSLGEEVRDPLSAVNLALDELSAEESLQANETAQMHIDIIKSNCNRINHVIKNFISSTESKALNLKWVPIAKVIEETIEELGDLMSGHHVQLTKQLMAAEVELLIDIVKIKSALNSVIKNAVEAISGFPKIIHITGAIENEMYEIGIEDNGIGIDPSDCHRIFEPFFTTRMRAVGLGLTHANRILVSHNGSIRVKSLAQGSLFLLQLPLNEK